MLGYNNALIGCNNNARPGRSRDGRLVGYSGKEGILETSLSLETK